mmetsp:Transcript_107337/g.239656  ORF Transcript_107337/g.239656 Transcript_107337/m.239656 type:complete len:231 (-) Transcript_107337:1637-2329(-)
MSGTLQVLRCLGIQAFQHHWQLGPHPWGESASEPRAGVANATAALWSRQRRRPKPSQGRQDGRVHLFESPLYNAALRVESEWKHMVGPKGAYTRKGALLEQHGEGRDGGTPHHQGGVAGEAPQQLQVEVGRHGLCVKAQRRAEQAHRGLEQGEGRAPPEGLLVCGCAMKKVLEVYALLVLGQRPTCDIPASHGLAQKLQALVVAGQCEQRRGHPAQRAAAHAWNYIAATL